MPLDGFVKYLFNFPRNLFSPGNKRKREQLEGGVAAEDSLPSPCRQKLEEVPFTDPTMPGIVSANANISSSQAPATAADNPQPSSGGWGSLAANGSHREANLLQPSALASALHAQDRQQAGSSTATESRGQPFASVLHAGVWQDSPQVAAKPRNRAAQPTTAQLVAPYSRNPLYQAQLTGSAKVPRYRFPGTYEKRHAAPSPQFHMGGAVAPRSSHGTQGAGQAAGTYTPPSLSSWPTPNAAAQQLQPTPQRYQVAHRQTVLPHSFSEQQLFQQAQFDNYVRMVQSWQQGGSAVMAAATPAPVMTMDLTDVEEATRELQQSKQEADRAVAISNAKTAEAKHLVEQYHLRKQQEAARDSILQSRIQAEKQHRQQLQQLQQDYLHAAPPARPVAPVSSRQQQPPPQQTQHAQRAQAALQQQLPAQQRQPPAQPQLPSRQRMQPPVQPPGRPAPAAKPVVRPAPAAEDVVELLDDTDEEAGEEDRQVVGSDGSGYVDGEVDEDEEEAEEGSEEEEEEEVPEIGDLALEPFQITQQLQAVFNRAMGTRQSSEKDLISEVRNVEVTRRHIRSMNHGEWLSDEVINLYMMLLLDRDSRQRASKDSRPRCHFFNTFFYNKLFVDDKKYNYNNVRRWTLPQRLKEYGQSHDNVLDLDKLIIPVHQGVHWVCAVINLRDKEIALYDSLLGKDENCLQHLLWYIRDEAQNKRNETWDMSEWRLVFPSNIPRQRNGCDCGVFTIKFADYISQDKPWDWGQAQMPYWRVKVVSEILDKMVH